VLAGVVALGVSCGVALPTAQADSSDWLGRVNLYRAAAGLSAVANEPAWQLGLEHHLTYLEKTPPSYFVGEYASWHTENPASPYYTDDGAQEAGSSNLFEGAVGWQPTDFIDGWLAAPFHGIGILRPGLEKVAFASDAQGSAGLDVLSGISFATSATEPVLFPGDGMTTNLSRFSGGESPDPLETCGWHDAGLPLIALLPQSPSSGASAKLYGPAGLVADTKTGGLCIVDAATYRSSDSVYGSTGAAILGSDNAVLVIPRAPLKNGAYEVTISDASMDDVAWRFKVSTSASPSLGAPQQRQTTRIAGGDRVATAVEVSRRTYPTSGSAGSAVLASSLSYPDALAGGPLAVAKHGPLLLTSPSELSSAVRSELRRALPSGGTVYVLGGEGAVAPAVVSAVEGLGFTVKRLGGDDRFGTALAIMHALGDPATVLETTGFGFPDGLAAGAAAAHVGGAVVLTRGSVADPQTAAAIGRTQGTRYAVGGPACQADPTATCISGTNRYATAAAVASRFFPDAQIGGVASGTAFPDALSGSAHAGALGAPVLLVSSIGEVPDEVAAYLSQTTSLTTLDVYGGPGAVSTGIAFALSR
jgi:hypothetical protein